MPAIVTYRPDVVRYLRLSEYRYSPKRSLGWLLAFVVILWSIALAASAQFPTRGKAPVVLDGRTLFNVAPTSEITADERAKIIDMAKQLF